MTRERLALLLAGGCITTLLLAAAAAPDRPAPAPCAGTATTEVTA